MGAPVEGLLTHQLADRVARLRDGGDLSSQGVASLRRKRREAVLAHAAAQLHAQLFADGGEGFLRIERPSDGQKKRAVLKLSGATWSYSTTDNQLISRH